MWLAATAPQNRYNVWNKNEIHFSREARNEFVSSDPSFEWCRKTPSSDYCSKIQMLPQTSSTKLVSLSFSSLCHLHIFSLLSRSFSVASVNWRFVSSVLLFVAWACPCLNLLLIQNHVSETLHTHTHTHMFSFNCYFNSIAQIKIASFGGSQWIDVNNELAIVGSIVSSSANMRNLVSWAFVRCWLSVFGKSSFPYNWPVRVRVIRVIWTEPCHRLQENTRTKYIQIQRGRAETKSSMSNSRQKHFTRFWFRIGVNPIVLLLLLFTSSSSLHNSIKSIRGAEWNCLLLYTCFNDCSDCVLIHEAQKVL